MFLKPKKNRSFHYQPRFYDPAKERREGRERRPIKFHRGKGGKTNFRSLISVVIGIGLILYILHQLSQLAR